MTSRRPGRTGYVTWAESEPEPGQSWGDRNRQGLQVRAKQGSWNPANLLRDQMLGSFPPSSQDTTENPSGNLQEEDTDEAQNP